MRYTVNISPAPKSNEFFGTGFFGEEISSFEDFKKQCIKTQRMKKMENLFFTTK